MNVLFKILAGLLFLSFCLAVLIELFVAKDKSVSFIISGTVVAGFFLYYLLSRKKIMNTMNPRANQLQ